MLFHNKYTISIGRLAVMLDSQQKSLVKRINIPLPKRVMIKAYDKLLTEVNTTLNRSSFEQEVETGILRLKLYNKAFNLYPALVDLCHITWDSEHLKKIEEITGIKLSTLEDRKILIAETERLQAKYRELIKQNHKEGGISFAELIISTEIILELNIPRDILLYEFEHYMKRATDKLHALENLKDR